MISQKCYYDLILLNLNFREVNQYPNIVRYLYDDLRIGLLNIPQKSMPPNLANAKIKVHNSDWLVTKNISQLGAEVIDPTGSYQCKLLLVPQSVWWFDKLPADITFDRCCALERFGSGAMGLDKLAEMGVSEFWTFDLNLFENIAHVQGFWNDIHMDVVEMGTPYSKYPAWDFSDLAIDYIFAYPTVMLLDKPIMRLGLYENIGKFMNSLNNNDRVVVKHHNVSDNGGSGIETFNHLIYKRLTGRFSPQFVVSVTGFIMDLFQGMRLSRLSEKAMDLRARSLEGEIIDSCVDLKDLTPFANFGIEHFLPFVRKGVITGISSCLWHALYNQVPVFNCDVRSNIDGLHNDHIYKVFFVPPCEGKSYFDESYFNLINNTARQADVIDLIRERIS